jgi:hypothetical protein
MKFLVLFFCLVGNAHAFIDEYARLLPPTAKAEADKKIAECNKNYECVSKAQKELQEKIAKIHEEIRKLDLAFQTESEKASKRFDDARYELTQILANAATGVIFSAVEQLIEKNPSIRLETYFTYDYLNKNEDFIAWYKRFNRTTSIYLNRAVMSSSFYFRNEKKQVHVGFASALFVYCGERTGNESKSELGRCKEELKKNSYNYLSQLIKNEPSGQATDKMFDINLNSIATSVLSEMNPKNPEIDHEFYAGNKLEDS